MKTIFLVQGSSGDYEDHTEWVYRAYTTLDKAILECKRLNDWIAAHPLPKGDLPKWRESLKQNRLDFVQIDPNASYVLWGY